MSARMLGMELELFLTKDGAAIGPVYWKGIVERAVARGCTRIDEAYTGFPMGASWQTGQFVLDNNCTVVELITLPRASLDETMDGLRKLLEFFTSLVPELELHWSSQFEQPNEDEYWRRTISSGLYGAVRKQKWRHWTLMNSLAFQPAIDLYADEITHVLRVLFLTSPVFVCAQEGNNRWGKEHSPRLEIWKSVFCDGGQRTGFPQREITSLTDYVENLLALPAFVIFEDGRAEQLTFFESKTVSAGDVMFAEVPAQRVLNVPDTDDMNGKELQCKDVRVRGDLASFYSLSLPFWNARLVFDTGQDGLVEDTAAIREAIEGAKKLYVEIRHIGTPRNLTELENIYGDFLKLVENARELDEKISAIINWQEAEEESRLAIRDGKPGVKSREVFKLLQSFELLSGAKL